MSITRYDIHEGHDYGDGDRDFATMEESGAGDFVRYSDYAALEAERDALKFRAEGAEELWVKASEELEKTRVQLAGCGAAAFGYRGDCKRGDYGWSASFGDVMQLRAERDRLRDALGALDVWQGNVHCIASEYSVSDDEWGDMQYIIHAALAHKEAKP